MATEQLKLSNQVCFRLYSVSRLVIQAYRPLLDRLGITYPQYLVLMVLWENDHLLVNDIAHRTARICLFAGRHQCLQQATA